MQKSVREKPLYKALTWSILAIGLLVLVFQIGKLTPLLTEREFVDSDDFVEYWTAARLNSQGHDPYDRDELTRLQHEIGRLRDVPVIMWNPPWTMALTTPFAAPGYSTGRLLWMLAGVILIFLCADQSWRLYDGSKKYLGLSWLIALVFMPTTLVIRVGQIGFFMLLGVIGFLYFEKRQQWLAAGLAASLISVKPHICYLFWIALLIWSLDRRKWSALIGVGAAILGGLAAASLFNPRLLDQYIYITLHYKTDWATPTIGGTLRYFLGVENFWMQFLAPALGAAWFLFFYWKKHRAAWQWSRRLPTLLMVSAFSTAFGWPYDLVVLIPAVVYVAVLLLRHNQPRLTYATGLVFLAINLLALKMTGDVFWLMWYMPALLLGYLLVLRKIKQPV